MLLAGLWFSREKATMTTYLSPLMKELKQLSEEGKRTNIYTQGIFIYTFTSCIVRHLCEFSY